MPIIPTIEVDGKAFVPQPSGRLVTPYTLDIEREFHEVRLELARQYGALNRLNRVAVRDRRRLDRHRRLRQHLPRDARGAARARASPTTTLRDAGIRLFELLMPIPLDRHDVRDFAAGLSEILVVEEKNPTLEGLVHDALYDVNERPTRVGQARRRRAACSPDDGMLDADSIRPALRLHLGHGLGATASLPSASRPDRDADPAQRQSRAVLLLGLPAQHLAPVSSPARSSAAASAATRWWC